MNDVVLASKILCLVQQDVGDERIQTSCAVRLNTAF